MIKAILVDDEKIAASSLEMVLKKTGKVEVKAYFNRADDALKFFEKDYSKRNKIDAAFIDIEMPKIDGLTLSNKIREIDKYINIVFTTAYNKYAVKAFGVEAIDYLIKPVSYDRLGVTIERLIKAININKLIAKSSEFISNKKYFSISCFGKFEIYKNKDEIINFRTKKAEELAAYFVHNVGRSVSQDKIIEDLWGDVGLDKAKIYFHANLYHVRKGFYEIDKENKIERHNENYKLVTNNLIDYVEFENLSKKPIKLNKNNVKYFEKITGLYKTGYLSENGYIWSLGRNKNLLSKFEEMELKIVRYYFSHKDYKKALMHLEKIIKINPYNEYAHESIIKIYYYNKDKISLENQIKVFEKILIDIEGKNAKEHIEKIKFKYKNM
ncbi:two-component SAPR family response regulator [Clostridium algifaecis]|uniref:Stage 0 sporulation protein A homolog n=1 Tax=Clostridium algifaecis TaxID=1472040 RepID=A0ABS4KRK8_9CLOT|nr:two-component SAPR family response regulator [Clostridium algifaecis]